MRVVCRGRIKSSNIISFFDGKIVEDVNFCTDSHKSYPPTIKKLNVNLK